MSWPLAANLSLLFTELPLLARIDAARQAGFAGVEIQFPYETPADELAAALSDAQLPLVLINLPAGDFMQGGAGLAAVPGRQAEFDAALAQALRYAAVARPERINVLPGRLAADVERPAALSCLVTNLRRAADAFAELGIRVCCEAINRLDMPGFLVSGAAELAELVADVNHPNCHAQLDLYHMARLGEVLPESIASLAGRIGHVQFADAPGRGAPGTGAIDYTSALAALQQAGYQGWLAAEYRPAGQTSDELQWLAQWRRAGWI